MLPLHTRPGDEWLVECEDDPEIGIMLRADVGPDPSLPPLNGWKFLKYDQSDQLKFVEDVDLTCSATAALPSCVPKVRFSGTAIETLVGCAGDFKATGLTSMGRQVQINSI